MSEQEHTWRVTAYESDEQIKEDGTGQPITNPITVKATKTGIVGILKILHATGIGIGDAMESILHDNDKTKRNHLEVDIRCTDSGQKTLSTRNGLYWVTAKLVPEEADQGGSD